MKNLFNVQVFNLYESIYSLSYGKLTEIPSEEEFLREVESIKQVVDEITEHPDTASSVIENNIHLLRLLVGLIAEDDAMDVAYKTMVAFDLKFESSILRFCMSYGMLKTIYSTNIKDGDKIGECYKLIKEDLEELPLADLLITGKTVEEAKRNGKV